MLKFKRISVLFLAAILIAAPPVAAGDADFLRPALTDGDQYYTWWEIRDYIQKASIYDKSDEELMAATLKAVLNAHPEVFETAMKGLLSAVDENSSFQTAEEHNVMMSRLGGEFYGIGVHIVEDGGYVIVTKPISGSPAEAAGILTGDILLSAGGKDLRGVTSETASGYIKGEEGAPVELIVKREGIEDPLTFIVTRAKIVDNPVEYKIYEDKGYAYVSLSIFSSPATAALDAALADVDSRGISKIILDLRDNPGGALDQAVNIAGRFVPNKGLIVSEAPRDKARGRTYYSPLEEKKYDLAVLVNGMSASASEIVTGAVKCGGAGVIVGEPTYGKGTVQEVQRVYLGGSFKLTIAQYLLPDGSSIHHQGISPDVYVKNRKVEADMTEIGAFTFDAEFSPGESSPQVKSAKTMLTMLKHYITKPESEELDESTALALASFQRSAGLEATGRLDLITQAMLIGRIKGSFFMKDYQLEKAVELLTHPLRN